MIYCVKVNHEYFVLQHIPFTLQCHNLVVNIIIVFWLNNKVLQTEKEISFFILT